MDRTSVQMTVSLSPILYRRAMDVAKREMRSKSDMVREALREYVVRRDLVEEARKDLAKRLKKRGIRTAAELESFIDAGRK